MVYFFKCINVKNYIKTYLYTLENIISKFSSSAFFLEWRH